MVVFLVHWFMYLICILFYQIYDIIVQESWINSFFKVHFIDYAITVVPFFFSSLFPSTLHCPPTSISPHLVPVHGSYIQILWLIYFLYYSWPPPVYFWPTIYVSCSLYLFSHSPCSSSPLITFHVISISVTLFLF